MILQFFVFIGGGEFDPTGIYGGDWTTQVLPAIRAALSDELSSTEIESKTKASVTLEGAITVCACHDITPSYFGPHEISGLAFGGDANDFLWQRWSRAVPVKDDEPASMVFDKPISSPTPAPATATGPRSPDEATLEAADTLASISISRQTEGSPSTDTLPV